MTDGEGAEARMGLGEALDQARQAGHIGFLDEQLAHALLRMVGCEDPVVGLLCALASHQVAEGHVCLPLGLLRTSREPLLPEPLRAELAELAPSALVERLQASGLAGQPAAHTPLVLHKDRLYLRRLFEHEDAVATQVEARS